MLKVDPHTHTYNSGHGLSTLRDYVLEARKRNIKLIGITEHGPTSKGASDLNAFDVHERVPREIDGITVLMGCELNVIDDKGSIDLPTKHLKKQGILSVGFHSHSPKGSRQENTRRLLKILEKHPYVHFVVHPYLADVDLQELASFTCKNDFLLELNTSTFKYKLDDEVLGKIRIMVQAVKNLDGKFLAGSDAHIYTDLGDDEKLREHYDYLGLSDDDLMNNHFDELWEYIQRKNKMLQNL